MKMKMIMKKQTIYIIVMFLSIILLCLIFGKSIIHEGNTTVTEQVGTVITTNGEVVNLNDAKKDLTKIDNISATVTNDLKGVELAHTAAEASKKLAIATSEIKSTQLVDATESLKKATESVTLASKIGNTSVLYLPLNVDSKNVAPDLGINNKTNMRKDAAVGQLYFGEKDGRKCVKFQRSNDNYISFPFTLTKNFSFCFWIYIDINDPNYNHVISASNQSYYNPAINIDIYRGRIIVCNALPRSWSETNPVMWGVLHDFTATSSGWAHMAYTFDQSVTSMKEKAKFYINKTKIPSQDFYNETPRALTYIENTVPVEYVTSFFNDRKEDTIRNLLYQPDTMFIGRSGGHGPPFGGYLREFMYFAKTLSIDDITKSFNQTA